MLEDYLSEKQKKKRKQKKAIWSLGIFIGIFLVALGVIWFFGESPFSRIDHVVVTGNRTVHSDAIVSLVEASIGQHRNWDSLFFGTRNMFAAPHELATSDIALIPQLADITLQKSYTTHTLTAVVVEREPLAIWCLMPGVDAVGNPAGDESCFWFDKDGVMFQKAFDTEGSALYAVHDYSQSKSGLGDTVLPDLFLNNVLSVFAVMQKSSLTVKEIALHDINLEEIDVSTYNGPDLYFSLRFPADNDLAVLSNLMAKPGFSSLQYVDFRTENRAYYK